MIPKFTNKNDEIMYIQICQAHADIYHPFSLHKEYKEYLLPMYTEAMDTEDEIETDKHGWIDENSDVSTVVEKILNSEK